MNALLLSSKIGFEIELAAPRGASRLTLAQALAGAGGSIRRVFHQESEPSKVPGTPIFHNLTLGFEALDAAGALIARCVDDLTLQADFDKRAAPKPGWFRIVSDDERLLRLIAHQVDPAAPMPAALEPLVQLFEGELLQHEGLHQVVDSKHAPICIAAPLPGERERPCELITPPLEHDHHSRLDVLLREARELNFFVPAESATHFHFDGAPFCSAKALRGLVRALSRYALLLRWMVTTPKRLQRIGAWPEALFELVERGDFATWEWPRVRAALKDMGLSKYTDYNLKNLALGDPKLHTLEIRILAGSLDTDSIIEEAAFFEAFLTKAAAEVLPLPEAPRAELSVDAARALIEALELSPQLGQRWMARVAKLAPIAEKQAGQKKRRKRRRGR